MQRQDICMLLRSCSVWGLGHLFLASGGSPIAPLAQPRSPPPVFRFCLAAAPTSTFFSALARLASSLPFRTRVHTLAHTNTHKHRHRKQHNKTRHVQCRRTVRGDAAVGKGRTHERGEVEGEQGTRKGGGHVPRHRRLLALFWRTHGDLNLECGVGGRRGVEHPGGQALRGELEVPGGSRHCGRHSEARAACGACLTDSK